MIISGNQQFIRNLNRLAVLRCVRLNPGISRVKLADTLKLTRPTIGNLVDDLLAQAWLSETKLGPTGALGRRPVALSLDSTRNALIGADINHKHVICVATTLSGKILELSITPTHSSNAETVLDILARQTRIFSNNLLRDGYRIAAMGVGAPGPVDHATGSLRYSDSTGWKKLPVKVLLQHRLKQLSVPSFPVLVQRAVACVALYHFENEVQTEEEPLIYVHVGHSVTSAIATRYSQVQGNSGMAGAIGHVVLDPSGPLCTCGKHGCVNTLASLRAVESLTGLSSDKILQLSHASDLELTAALQTTGRHFGDVLHNLCVQFDPARLFIGGALIQASSTFMNEAKSQLDQLYAQSGLHAPRIETVPSNTNSVALGAATGALYSLVRPLA